MGRKTEFWINLHQNEISSMQAALSAYLSVNHNISCLSEKEVNLYHQMRDEMKYIQFRLNDVIRMAKEEILTPEQ